MFLKDAVNGFVSFYLRELLRDTKGNVTMAAQRAGRNRTELYRLLHRHSVKPRQYREKRNSERERK